VAATITVGAAPLENDEIDQMIGLNATAKRFVLDGDRGALTSLLSETRTSILDDPLGSFRSIMETAPPADQEIIGDPDWQSSSVLDITEALRTGVEGWVDESWALFAPWDDIDPAEVTTSVTWWHSRDDRNAPLSAACRLVAQLPDARLEIWDDGGHLTRYRLEVELLDELLARW